MAPITRAEGLLGLGSFAGFAALLVLVPRLIPPSPDGFSAAAVQGYNTAAAFWSAAGWALVTVLTAAALHRWGAASAPPAAAEARCLSPVARSISWWELAAVFVVFAVAYWPWFLARHGPYGEDHYFLGALHRMTCGELPYRDFGFNYGPLMIYPLWGWTEAVGYSKASYFGFLSLLEGLVFVLVMVVLQVLIGERRWRYLAFAALVPILFNTLLGLNYNGLRFLVPTVAMMAVAARPFDRRATMLCTALLGLHLAYSHEYAVAGLMGVAGVYGMLLLGGNEGWRRTGATAASIVVGALVVWAVTVVSVLGDTSGSYVRYASEVLARMSAGHAAFRFYWTGNSLALFGVLTVACITAGRVLARGRRRSSFGDRLMVGALVFAVVALKSGLNRADFWHLNAGFLPLIIAFTVAMTGSGGVRVGPRRLAGGLVTVVSVTYLIGAAPYGSLYAVSYVKGLVDTVAGPVSPAPPGATRTRSLEFERTEPRPALVRLGRYLAAPERLSTPVFFYGRAWDLAPLVGVCRDDYKLDDLMYTEFSRLEREDLRARPETLVVMVRDSYERLYGLRSADAPHYGMPMTPTKELGRWLATVHYDAGETEARLQNESRARLLGHQIRETHRLAAEFDGYVVLQPTTK